MKKTIFSIALILSSLSLYSQKSVIIKDSAGNYYQTKELVRDSLTNQYFTSADGERYQLFQTKTGRLYCIRTSKNTGKEYRFYLPIKPE